MESIKRILKILGYIAFVSWLFLFINGLSPQIQMFLFNGNVFVYNVFWKFLFLISVVTIFILKRESFPKAALLPYSMFLIYSIFHSIYLYHQGFKILPIIFSYNSYYFYIFLLPFLPSLSGILDKDIIVKIFKILFIPIIIIGLLQHFLNATIFPVSSYDSYFKVFSYNFYGKLRPFSLFVNPGLFMFYLIFMLGIFMEDLKERKYLSFLAILLSIYLIMFSSTRTTYLLILFVFISFIIRFIGERKSFFDKLFKYLPVLYGITGFVIVFIIYHLTFNVNYFNKKIDISELERKFIEVKNQIFFEDKLKINEINKYEKSFKEFKYFNFKNISPEVKSPEVKSPEVKSPEVKSPEVKSPEVTSTDSFIMRILEWKIFGSLVFENWETFLFGKGYVQNDRFPVFKDLIIDNLYLNILLFSGVAGFFILFWLLWSLWKFIIEQNQNNIIYIWILSILSTILLTGSFGMVLCDYMILITFLLCFLIKNKNI
jgi:hypothetical protein